jgi:anti-anti-sigma factor
MQMLAADGYLIEHAATLGAGIERARASDIDALLLDLNLPDSQGIATILAAREQLPAMPIVVLTDAADDGTISTAFLRGVQDFLFKSKVTPDWLRQSVKHAILRGKLLEPIAADTAKASEPAKEAASIWSQEQIDEVVVLRLLPKRLLDAGAILAIEERLTSLVERGNHQLVVSMEDVEYISNAALGVLIGTQRKMRNKNRRMHLANLRKNVRNQLGSRQFHRLFQIYDDVPTAIASINPAN